MASPMQIAEVADEKVEAVRQALQLCAYVVKDEKVSREDLYVRMTSAISDAMAVLCKEYRLRKASERQNRWLRSDMKRERERNCREEQRLLRKISELENHLIATTEFFDDEEFEKVAKEVHEDAGNEGEEPKQLDVDKDKEDGEKDVEAKIIEGDESKMEEEKDELHDDQKRDEEAENEEDG